jgi:antitoxin ParD1/3/4
MNRQSITLTEPNNSWLNKILETREYSSKSEVINDLIRQHRNNLNEIEYLRIKLKQAEESGFTNLNKMEILKEAKSRLNE